MKKMIYFTLLFLFVSPLMLMAQNAQVSFSVAVSNIPGNFAPRHVIAIWVEDETGNYINSLAVYGSKRLGYLSTWYGASKGIKGDAVTGATVSSFRTYNVTWDLKDVAGNTVPDGTYILKIEATSKNGAGPQKSIQFTVGGSTYSETPAGDTYYKNMTLEYNSNDATPVTVMDSNPEISFYPNPVRESLNMNVNFSKPMFATVQLIDLTGRNSEKLFSGVILSGEQSIKFDRDPALNKGAYFLQVKTNEFVWTQKIVLE
ncbi:DUF2271 domain-containing protein [Saccharicrinis sp. FJH54]|uniref:DUF2271 domain-containing protein n=1 Tax=Saccharicrinis sp. FJH54 TaxID=3344665 RepID=UPI0035D49D85